MLSHDQWRFVTVEYMQKLLGSGCKFGVKIAMKRVIRYFVQFFDTISF